uniref:CSON014968 protein n=1 Tax=Culicoides sonorensis TaxID=179676 RepID=A0A336KVN0_CULSO
MKFVLQVIFIVAGIDLIWARPPRECMLPDDSRDCCPKYPKVVNETLIHECMRETFQQKKGFGCAFECYTNLTKISLNGKIEAESAVTSMVSMLSPEFAEWKDILTKGIQRCAILANNDTYKQLDAEEPENPMEIGREQCTKRSGYFLACVGGQMYLNCPSDIWNNTTTCSEYKAVVQKCNVYLPPPPHGHGHHHHHHHHHPNEDETVSEKADAMNKN